MRIAEIERNGPLEALMPTEYRMENEMDAVLIEKSHPMAWLTLNRPEKRNALGLDVMKEIIAKLDEVAADAECVQCGTRHQGDGVSQQ